METITAKALEALAYALKATNVVEITLEEAQNFLRKIVERVNNPQVVGAAGDSQDEQIVCKAVERLAE